MQRFLMVVLCLAVSLFAFGCTKATTFMSSKAQSPAESNEATVAAVGASIEGTITSVPQGVPVWPGAVVLESSETEDGISISLSTPDPYDDVFKGVAVGFERAEWTVAKEEAGADGERVSVLTVECDSLEGVVTIIENPDLTVGVDYVLSPLSD